MFIFVDGKQRELPRISTEIIDEIRQFRPELKNVNSAFRMDLSQSDLGKKITGVNFEVHNHLGRRMILKSTGKSQDFSGEIFRKPAGPKIEILKSHKGNVLDLIQFPRELFAEAASPGGNGYGKDLRGNLFYTLNPNTSVKWMEFKPDVWLMCKALSSDDAKPAFWICATAELYYNYEEPPVSYSEAVICYISDKNK